MRYCVPKEYCLAYLGYFQLPNFESARTGSASVYFTFDASQPSSNALTLYTGNYGREKQTLAFVTIATKW